MLPVARRRVCWGARDVRAHAVGCTLLARVAQVVGAALRPNALVPGRHSGPAMRMGGHHMLAYAW